MPDWQININKVAPFFNPENRQTMLGDNVYWTNNTEASHLPWPLDSKGQPEPTGWGLKEIPPQQSSVSLPVPGTTTGVTYRYYCRLHPQNSHERGAISVLAAPPTV